MTPNDIIAYRHAQPHRKVRGKAHKGISQRQLAERLGVSTKSVQNWEQGVCRIPNWVGKVLKIETQES